MNSKIKFRNWLKKTVWASGGLCVLCCLLPLIGLSLGVGGIGVAAFYLEKISFGVLAISIVALLFWQIPKHPKKACPTDCGCKVDSTSDLPIACDLTAIGNEKRGDHIETAKKLFASFKEVRELPDGFAFRLPTDSDSIMQAVTFILTERICCPFFTFTLQMKDKGESVWLSLTGGESVKLYLHDTLLNGNGEEVLSLNEDVRASLSSM